MKKAIIFLITIFILEPGNSQVRSGNKNAANAASTIMWNNQPARTWNEATPIGNGRLGGMVFGGVTHERIQTNDDTFWSGIPREIQNNLRVHNIYLK